MKKAIKKNATFPGFDTRRQSIKEHYKTLMSLQIFSIAWLLGAIPTSEGLTTLMIQRCQMNGFSGRITEESELRPLPYTCHRSRASDRWRRFSSSSKRFAVSGSGESDDVAAFLAVEYPDFYSLLSTREGVWKRITESGEDGVTLFAPTAEAFAALGDKRCIQLKDERNLEPAQRVAGFHLVETEAVTLEVLQRPTVEGLMTASGELKVDRKTSGGFLSSLFGGGDQSNDDDAVVVVGKGATVSQSHRVGTAVIHEVDRLVSPEILWRYFDQLRIPGF